ncbi:charged multivesicular body protein 5 [Thecamonas trahens ATCC 50062]|uniref:Charged multivesicular body protein 5 n=1 Tax=Thecamonas trahens ATCC 50062 TaxID=461836 RepID=A0A0L0DPE4_THETB|nr:charged multivesicular body protein 5 [Thecamonas trahens ATCC 50062]KNC54174.1 charged multivesicular body protein 5 [Thecamonas trahens ATCC 50062]|eukprot:XP_013753991.1 charged multivesicular body protein 5 [Thecamonas trahens ATCC 50062]
MKRLFGVGAKKAPPPSLSDTTGNIDKRVDGLNEKIRKLDAELLRYKKQMAKMRPGAAKNGVKQRALRVLRQKKMYEQQMDQLMQQSFNIEQTAFAIETAQDTVQTVTAMKEANKQLKKQFNSKALDIDAIEDLQDDMEDLFEQNQDIQEAMARSYGVAEDFDEEDLDAELDALGELDDFDFEMESNATPSYLSDVSIPTTTPGAVPAAGETEEVDEFGLPLVPAQTMGA